MKKKKKTSFRSKYILITLTLLCAIMITMSFFTDITAGPLKTVSNFIVVPIQKGINNVGLWLNSKSEYFQEIDGIIAKNAVLTQQLDVLTAENTVLQQRQYELERLREYYNLEGDYSDSDIVAARIISKAPGNWYNVFNIDKGSNDGLAKDMNVLSLTNGLVGIVIDVGPDWAKVRAIIDDTSKISAMVLNTGDRCIVNGDLRLIDNNKITFTNLVDNDQNVKVGDKLVTSNISNKYLSGILIGYITEIKLDSNNLTYSGTLTPVVDFGHLQEVIVLTELKMTGDGNSNNEGATIEGDDVVTLEDETQAAQIVE
jgi:rod shape-determining protein MreC